MFNNDGNLFNVVKVKKSELLTVLKGNLESHIKDVTEAMELRRIEVREYFADQIEMINENCNFNPREVIEFPKPADNSSDYKKAIRMVEMTQDDIIELNESQFDRLVMDNWDWKRSLVSTSALYGKSI